MIKVPDAAWLAAMHVLSEHLFRRVGGSTGTNFFGICAIAANMMKHGETGSLVSIICDSGDRYLSTYYDTGWLADNNIDIAPYKGVLEKFLADGVTDDLRSIVE